MVRFQSNVTEHDPEVCYKNVTSWGSDGPCKVLPKFAPFGMNVSDVVMSEIIVSNLSSNCMILTVSPQIYAIGEKKIQGFNGIRTRDLRKYLCDALPTELRSHTLGARLLFPNCINWWAHGEDRAVACFSTNNLIY